MKVIVLFLFICPLFAFSDLQLRLVTELHPLEGKREQLFVNDHLWSLNSATKSIDVFDANLKKVRSITLEYSMSRLARFDGQSVLVYGKITAPSWAFFFTRIDTATFEQATYQLPESIEVFPDQFTVSESGEVFFADIPGRAVWRYRLGAIPKKIPVDIGVPTNPTVVGNYLYVIENHSLGSDSCKLVKIDLSSETAVWLFEPSPLLEKISDLALLSDGKTLAAAQVWGQKVILIDTQSDTLVSTLPVAGSPRDIEEVGRCIAVASEESREVSFLDWRQQTVVSTWNLSAAGQRLERPGTISIDRPRGRVYARSAYPCIECQATQSSVFVAEETDAATFRACGQ